MQFINSQGPCSTLRLGETPCVARVKLPEASVDSHTRLVIRHDIKSIKARLLPVVIVVVWKAES